MVVPYTKILAFSLAITLSLSNSIVMAGNNASQEVKKKEEEESLDTLKTVAVIGGGILLGAATLLYALSKEETVASSLKVSSPSVFPGVTHSPKPIEYKTESATYKTSPAYNAPLIVIKQENVPYANPAQASFSSKTSSSPAGALLKQKEGEQIYPSYDQSARSEGTVIDLHGCTFKEAKTFLKRRLLFAYLCKREDANIITGQGSHSTGKDSTLQQAVPSWISEAPFTTYVKKLRPSLSNPGAFIAILNTPKAKAYKTTYLNFNFNKLGSLTSTLGELVLPKISCLRVLSLKENRIGKEECKSLARYLNKNTSLETLNLANNEIEDQGAIILAESIQHHPSLETLNLAGNRVSDKGVKGIACFLAHNHELLQLNIEQ